MASSPPTKEEKTKVVFRSIEGVSLEDILNLPIANFVERDDAHRQLNYIDDYVRNPALACKSVVLEQHYIDRDYIEDHSVFYSKSLANYDNYCCRVHFFSLPPEEVRTELRRIRALRSESKEKEVLLDACKSFSHSHYIGFAIIKPLPGCPVGRTVLRPLPENSGKGHLRKFKCICEFEIHTLGIPLTVKGLPFQQQDLGVSACATTALWMSLQRASQLEQAGAATPAHITIRASQFALPFGRPMPSEGLSLDQMCQAVQSLGYSPCLYRCRNFEVTRALLYSAISSGVSPVLILESLDSEDRHAVAVAGMAISPALVKSVSPSQRKKGLDLHEGSEDMTSLYVHDDRYGPYLKAAIARRKQELLIRYRLLGKKEEWLVSHILIPLHAKIRLSLVQLYLTGLRLLDSEVQPFSTAIGAVGITNWKCRIFRAHVYVDSLLKMAKMDTLVERLCECVSLSRYLGVIRFEAPGLDAFDVILDTTGTERNLNCLAVVQLGRSSPITEVLCQMIASNYNTITIC